MSNNNVMDEIENCGLIAVIRGNTEERGEMLADAVSRGGIKALEITMTVPGALDVIKKLSQKYKDTDILVGSGTVLDAESARACIFAGSCFVVSPIFDEGAAAICNSYGVPYVPGVMTVREAVLAMRAGARVLKLFPANAYEPSIIKSFKGPLPQALFIPTGGISTENCGEWINAGAVAVGSGGDLTKGDDYEEITRRAARFVAEVAKARISNK